jgi:hypothetical protein
MTSGTNLKNLRKTLKILFKKKKSKIDKVFLLAQAQQFAARNSAFPWHGL